MHRVHRLRTRHLITLYASLLTAPCLMALPHLSCVSTNQPAIPNYVTNSICRGACYYRATTSPHFGVVLLFRLDHRSAPPHAIEPDFFPAHALCV
ncbi:hypothetical protein F4604DRAFT_1784518 [Suillus subluteus]|nr:hypothetical protein F4604DRAFT_1784518 [Suillus subluteus]